MAVPSGRDRWFGIRKSPIMFSLNVNTLIIGDSIFRSLMTSGKRGIFVFHRVVLCSYVSRISHLLFILL